MPEFDEERKGQRRLKQKENDSFQEDQRDIVVIFASFSENQAYVLFYPVVLK